MENRRFRVLAEFWTDDIHNIIEWYQISEGKLISNRISLEEIDNSNLKI